MPDRLCPSKKFTKADIIDALYEKTEMNRADIREAVDLVIDEIKKALVQRKVIELRGFGTFETKIRKARLQARNPRTGEQIVIKSRGAVIFRAGCELKQALKDITDDNTCVPV